MARKKQLKVEDTIINVKVIAEEDYISLTDMVGERGRAGAVIQNWLRNRNTLEFLGVWEKLYNDQFKVLEFEYFFSQSGLNRFTLSVKEWTEKTDAVGLVSKAGRGGGTFAHRDIAFEFGAFISPEFKLLLIRDYQRLKSIEYNQQQLQWDYHRFLSKVNYRLHTDAIRDKLLPALRAHRSEAGKIYATEADILNKAVFGMTAAEWREANPQLALKGNIRDFADVVSLNVLANLESFNAIMIGKNVNQTKRIELLTEIAIEQYERLLKDERLKRLGGKDELLER